MQTWINIGELGNSLQQWKCCSKKNMAQKLPEFSLRGKRLD